MPLRLFGLAPVKCFFYIPQPLAHVRDASWKFRYVLLFSREVRTWGGRARGHDRHIVLSCPGPFRYGIWNKKGKRNKGEKQKAESTTNWTSISIELRWIESNRASLPGTHSVCVFVVRHLSLWRKQIIVNETKLLLAACSFNLLPPFEPLFSRSARYLHFCCCMAVLLCFCISLFLYFCISLWIIERACDP